MTQQTQIFTNEYDKILSEIRRTIEQTQGQIIKTVTRQKVVMAWQIGKTINDYLLKNDRADYGDGLFKKLSQDTLIAQKTLYKMSYFYKFYPQLPNDDDKLNWSHYRVLSGIKEEEKRKYFENLIIENGWGRRELEDEVQRTKKLNEKNESTPVKLEPIRGQLFSYPLAKFANSDQSYIDCGFNIFRQVEETLPQGLNEDLQSASPKIEVIKTGQEYSIRKSDLPFKKLNIYKAYLERVVDGDTIRVILDLGFKIFHKEILRLKGINAPEMKSKEGKKNAEALGLILKDVSFLVIKTIKIDIYGRYVADVFFDDGSIKTNDPQKIADEGIYLNQLLLDKGFAVYLDM